VPGCGTGKRKVGNHLEGHALLASNSLHRQQQTAMKFSLVQLVSCCVPADQSTWLDLSFNKIQVIEGLDSLVKLQDLSSSATRSVHCRG